jgi:hypothetical protein
VPLFTAGIHTPASSRAPLMCATRRRRTHVQASASSSRTPFRRRAPSSTLFSLSLSHANLGAPSTKLTLRRHPRRQTTSASCATPASSSSVAARAPHPLDLFQSALAEPPPPWSRHLKSSRDLLQPPALDQLHQSAHDAGGAAE